MRRLVEAKDKPEARSQPVERLVIPVDAISEATVLAAVMRPELTDGLLRRLSPDQFLVRENREAWVAIGDVRRRGLTINRSTLAAVAGEGVADHIVMIVTNVLDASENVDWHVRNMLWDGARATAAKGPVPAFLEALRDPRAEPERVRSLARQITNAFDGYEDRKHLLDGGALVRDQMLEIERRVAGHASYPYGIAGLDFFDDSNRRRMIPGAAPGQFTVLTAVPGAGKSTTAANMALGIAFPNGAESDEPGRKVLYCAWEMGGGMSLELLACISLGWSRTSLMDPASAAHDAPILSHEGRRALQTRMDRLTERIRFLAMPFRRMTGEKATNDRNLDTFQGYIADAGCEVVIADLWKRLLRDASPDEEEDALIRQQAIAVELHVHLIALQQQRLKDLELRVDKRPTREGIKGSGAWVEIPDTIIGLHRPALWKRMDDDHIEALILKQRYGTWPCAIEFDWDADRGTITGGRSAEYDRPGEASEMDSDFLRQPGRARRRTS